MVEDLPEVPKYLQQSFDSSKKDLSVDEQVRLSEHKDVFAQDKFDFGAFTEIHHGIQTEQSAPIKQTHARNPSLFRPWGGGSVK